MPGGYRIAALGCLSIVLVTSPRGGAEEGCLAVSDPVCLRDDLRGGPGDTCADPLPSDRGRRLVRFVQLSDSHILDDDGQFLSGLAPLDPLASFAASAQRLQQEYSDEVLNAMLRTVTACHAQDPIDFAVTTGDNTDLGTLGELRRFIDNLDGTFDQTSAFEEHCAQSAPPYLPEEARAEHIAHHCTRFTGRGVADTQTIDPEPGDPDEQDDPSEVSYQVATTGGTRQLVETEVAVISGRDSEGNVDPSRQTLTRAPGLPAELRCDSSEEGCGNEAMPVPWYVAFGNHDELLRGSTAYQPGLQESAYAAGRRFLRDQHDFIFEFFHTKSDPIGHGFDEVDLARLADPDGRNDGYYALDAPGSRRIRLIVLNTLIDGAGGGVSTELRSPFAFTAGAIDPEQFDWLRGQLGRAEQRRQLVLVFSHHPDASFVEFSELGFAVPGLVTAAELDAEMASHPNVVAWIAGHTHRNRVRAFRVTKNDDGTHNGSNGLISTEVACPAGKSCRGRFVIAERSAPGQVQSHAGQRSEDHEPARDPARQAPGHRPNALV